MSRPNKPTKRDEQMEIDPASTWEPPPPVAQAHDGKWVFKSDTPMEMVKSRIVVDGVTFLKMKQIGPVGPVEYAGRKTMLRLWLCVRDGDPIPAPTFVLAEPVQ